MKKLMFGFMVLAYLAAGLVTVCGALFLEAMAQSDAPQLAVAATLWGTIAGAAIVFCILMAVGAREIYMLPIKKLKALGDGHEGLSLQIHLCDRLKSAAAAFHLASEWEIEARKRLRNEPGRADLREDVARAAATVAKNKKHFWALHGLVKSFGFQVEERYTDYLE